MKKFFFLIVILLSVGCGKKGKLFLEETEKNLPSQIIEERNYRF